MQDLKRISRKILHDFLPGKLLLGMNTLKPSPHYKAKARMQHHCAIYVRDSFPRGGKSEMLIINTNQGAVYNYVLQI